jgi:hypothetical protein
MKTYTKSIKIHKDLGTEVHDYNHSTWEAEEEEWGGQGQPRLYSETLPKKKSIRIVFNTIISNGKKRHRMIPLMQTFQTYKTILCFVY